MQSDGRDVRHYDERKYFRRNDRGGDETHRERSSGNGGEHKVDAERRPKDGRVVYAVHERLGGNTGGQVAVWHLERISTPARFGKGNTITNATNDLGDIGERRIGKLLHGKPSEFITLLWLIIF